MFNMSLILIILQIYALSASVTYNEVESRSSATLYLKHSSCTFGYCGFDFHRDELFSVTWKFDCYKAYSPSVENGSCCPCTVGVSCTTFYRRTYLAWSTWWQLVETSCQGIRSRSTDHMCSKAHGLLTVRIEYSYLDVLCFDLVLLSTRSVTYYPYSLASFHKRWGVSSAREAVVFDAGYRYS